MRTSRLEAFSDGVFAIAITLLVLGIQIPDVPYAQLPAVMLELIPKLATYVLSFALIGMYWAFHHVYFDRVKQINGTMLFVNLLLLLLISFMPFPTALIGRYPLQPWPIVLYGLNLIGANMTGLLMVLYLRNHQEFLQESWTGDFVKDQLRVYAFVNIPYAVALVTAFWLPTLSYTIFFVILIGVSISLWKRLNHK